MATYDWLDTIMGAGQPAQDYLAQAFAGPRQAAGMLTAPVTAPPPPPPPAPPVFAPAEVPQPDMRPVPAVADPRERDPYLRQVGEAIDARQLATMKESDLAAAKAAYTGEQSALAALQSAQRQREIETDRSAWNGETDRKMQEIELERQKLAATKIDPQRVYKDASTGGKIASVAMGFLAGFLNPKGGAQTIVDQITGLVDRDVQGQLANLEQKNRMLGIQQQQVGTDMQRKERMLDAALRADAMAYDTAMRLVTAEAARFDSPIAAEKAQQVAALLRQEYADRVQAYRQQREQMALQRSSVAQGWARLAQEDAEKAALKQAAADAIPEGAIPNTGDPRGWTQLVDKGMAKDVIKEKNALEGWIQLNRRMIALKAQHPGHLWDNYVKTDEGAEAIRSLRHDLVASYSAMTGAGALGDEERANIERAKVGDFGRWINNSSSAAMEESIRTAEDRYNTTMHNSAHPRTPFRTGLRYDATRGTWYLPVKSEGADTLEARWRPGMPATRVVDPTRRTVPSPQIYQPPPPGTGPDSPFWLGPR